MAALAAPLLLAACAGQPATPLPNPEQLAQHEWDHGAPWGPEEQPWVAPPPQVLAIAPGHAYGPGYWGPGWWGPSVGLGIGVGRGHWWHGHRGHYGGFHAGGWGGPRHFSGRRGRR
ncbi:hypothetical protein [Paracraurococcus ruber]|uniref:hypothetical protein n=1 Tax=Paracraurococcus ruber TaxID=77675 RepID=UPI0010575FEA|nr:hypothetical protein [Paracraurococcus ruber]TDG32054.1 hypothetical protein E2C05_08855 [Paracraurococcus ruber]